MDAGNLCYCRARYYNPLIGRFLSEDPAGLADSMNFYYSTGDSPVNSGDPLGLWSPDAHDALIQHALSHCGVSDGDISAIQQASRGFDSATGGAEDWSFAHSMRAPDQSVDNAVDMRNQFVADQPESARLAYQQGDTPYALSELGWGIHPIMDFTSPEHKQLICALARARF
jgi:uncharacterized protein RhaS with RHS repeats